MTTAGLDVDRRCPVAPGDVLADKFVIEGVLGSGAMGVVVSAHHKQLGERVAIKFLVDARPDSADRFERELRIVARLRGEHVVRVLDGGRTDRDVPFLVMEYLRGETLSEVLRRGPMDPALAADYVLQVCEGLAEPHSARVVHRDIKPSNLFLTCRSDGSPLVKVIDFGIAKIDALGEEGELTSTHAIVGSPTYASPEQLTTPKDVDARSDIWSCGVTLFRMVTGRLPFDGATLAQLCMNIVSDPAPSACALLEDIPEALDAVIQRCLEKTPDHRFADVAALADALEACAHRGAKGTARRVSDILARAPSIETSRVRDVRVPAAPRATAGSLTTEAMTGPFQDTTEPGTLSSSSLDSRSAPSTKERSPRFAIAVGTAAAIALGVAAFSVGHASRAPATSASTKAAISAAPVDTDSPPTPSAVDAPAPFESASAPATVQTSAPKKAHPQLHPRAHPESRNTGAHALVCPGDPRCTR